MPADPVRRLCPECGAEIAPMAHPRRVFCSTRCKNAEFNRLTSEARRAARSGRSCRFCGGPISDDKRTDAVYCSIECQRQWRRDARRKASPRA
jgi:endogenous inhibitor of DNA gyrase (YacG/DUF329 family)